MQNSVVELRTLLPQHLYDTLPTLLCLYIDYLKMDNTTPGHNKRCSKTQLSAINDDTSLRAITSFIYTHFDLPFSLLPSTLVHNAADLV